MYVQYAISFVTFITMLSSQYITVSKRSFDLGFRFYYHDHYKNIHRDYQNQQYVENHNDHGGYSPAELFVESKYFSLKDEIVNNTVQSMSIYEVNISLVKAEKLLKTYKAKSMRVRPFGVNDPYHYEIDDWAQIRYSHIVALIMYSDWTNLQCAFSKTFRRKHRFETLSSVKQRNREFYWWSRNLREAVECYGNWGWGFDGINDEKWNANWLNKRGPFYNGMNYAMVIPEIMIRLNGPCSSSRQIEVAMRFAGSDGILIQMNNNSYKKSYGLRCFDMNWLSQYQGEDEYLWIGGTYRIRIESIRIISNGMNFERYFRTLYYFDAMITGMDIGWEKADTMTSSDLEALQNLINYRMGDVKNEYPEYINDTFAAYTSMKTQIVIKIHDLYGYFHRIKDLIIHIKSLVYNVNDGSYSTKYFEDTKKLQASRIAGYVPEVKFLKTEDGFEFADMDFTLKPLFGPLDLEDKESYCIKSVIYNLFPNLQSIILITTSWENLMYHKYRVDISDLLSLRSKDVAITLKADHEYFFECDDQGRVVSKTYLEPSWLNEWNSSKPKSFKSNHNISYQKEIMKYSGGNECIVDILKIGSVA